MLVRAQYIIRIMLDSNLKELDFNKQLNKTQQVQFKALSKLNGFSNNNLSESSARAFLMEMFTEFNKTHLTMVNSSHTHTVIDFVYFTVSWQLGTKFKIRETYIWKKALDILSLELSEWLTSIAILSITVISFLFILILIKYLA